MVVTKASEQIFAQANSNVNKQVFGNLFYHAKAYGIKGDGSTDDSAAIQAAMDIVGKNGGGILLFPASTYIVSIPIYFNYDNITLMSFDPSDTIIKLKSNCTPKPFSLFVTQTTPRKNISMIGLTIDGNRVNNVDHGTPDVNGNQANNWIGTLLALINLTQVTNLIIRDCTVQESWGSGIWLSDCLNILVQNVVAKNYRMSGIAIRNNISITGVPSYNTVINCTGSGGVNGIHSIFGNTLGEISENYCYNNRDSNRFPSYAYNGTYPNIAPSTGGFKQPADVGYITPSLVGDGAGIESTGVYTGPAGTPSDLQISVVGNVCTNNMVGIRMEEESRNYTIDGNICTVNDKYGIFIFSSFFNSITDNVCSNNLIDGIRLEKLVGVGKARSDQNTIIGNTCTQNNQWGISILGGRQNIITGNNLSDNNKTPTNTGGGIGLFYTESTYESSRNIIADNMMISYSSLDKYGVYSDNAANSENTVSGNIFQSQLTSACNLDKNLNLITGNNGFKTSNFGQSNIAVSATTVVASHGMPFTPANGEIQVTPVNQPPGVWWVDTITATQFTIHVAAAVTGVPCYFNWSVNGKDR